MENVLEIKGLCKEIKKFKVEGVEFSLEKGFIMGLVGPNGSGKTTTIKLIMNLLSKDEGEINIFGLDNARDEVEIKQKVGFVYDENIYPFGMMLGKIAKYVAPFYSRWSQETFEKYMKRFGLDLESKIEDLSKGMTTKFAIAIALSHKPELLMMDEPTSGLDPVFRRELLDIIQEIMEDGTTSVLFSTHITSDLEKVADYITFMDRGKVFISESYTNIIKRYRIIKGSPEILDQYKEGIIGYKTSKFGAEGLSENWEKLGKLNGVILQQPSIEDIMYFISRFNQGESLNA